MFTSRLCTVVALLASAVYSVPTAPTLEKRASVFTTCTTSEKVVALTFDDGPYIYNTQLVNYLNSQGVKATFFMNGNNYDCIYDAPYPSYVRHTYDSGHQIGSHTWDHPDLETLSPAAVTQELVRINEALVYILGVKPRYFRPPYGDINPAVSAAVAAQHQVAVTWNFDSGDSTGSTVAESEQAYTNWIKTGKSFIALNHETYPGTVQTLVEKIIPQLKKAGYKFVTVAECLNQGSAYVTPAGPKGPGHC